MSSSSSSYSSSSSSDSASDVEVAFEKLNFNQDSDFNILLLGETGVGKSTFINAMGNYLCLKYFSNAEDKGLIKVIPSVYTIQDKNGKYHEVKINATNRDEKIETGESATQKVNTYVFLISGGNKKIRLIDTPGMGDTRGVEQDEKNLQNIISYIRTLEKIHAICFLIKPTQVRKTIYFEYCIYQILCFLERSASKNIFFFFPRTRGSDYTAGDTLSILKIILKNIENDTGVKIPLEENKNIFCFDNEAFRYLGAQEQNVKFEQSIKNTNRQSWEHSARQCWRFLKIVQNDINPYIPTNLSKLNKARKALTELSKILSNITTQIEANDHLLERIDDKRNILHSEAQVENEKIKLDDVQQIRMDVPMLVCTSVPSCAEIYKVRGLDKWHYKNICHYCYELSSTDIRMLEIGCPEVLKCHTINRSNKQCDQCGCDFMLHMHIDYITRRELIEVDEDVNRSTINSKLLDDYNETNDNTKNTNTKLQREHNIIKKFCMNIALFIRDRSILAFSESYKDYVIYLIDQKRAHIESSPSTSIEDLERFVKECEEIEIVFKDSLKTSSSFEDLTFDMQDYKFRDLIELCPLYGHEIESLWNKLEQAPSISTSVIDYVHDTFFESKRGRQNMKPDGNQSQHPANRGMRNRGLSRGFKKQSASRSRSRNRSRSSNAFENRAQPDTTQNNIPDYTNGNQSQHPANRGMRNRGLSRGFKKQYASRSRSRNRSRSRSSNAFENRAQPDTTQNNIPDYTSHRKSHSHESRSPESLNINIDINSTNQLPSLLHMPPVQMPTTGYGDTVPPPLYSPPHSATQVYPYQGYSQYDGTSAQRQERNQNQYPAKRGTGNKGQSRGFKKQYVPRSSNAPPDIRQKSPNYTNFPRDHRPDNKNINPMQGQNKYHENNSTNRSRSKDPFSAYQRATDFPRDRRPDNKSITNQMQGQNKHHGNNSTNSSRSKDTFSALKRATDFPGDHRPGNSNIRNQTQGRNSRVENNSSTNTVEPTRRSLDESEDSLPVCACC